MQLADLTLAKEEENAAKYTIGVTKIAWLILGRKNAIRWFNLS